METFVHDVDPASGRFQIEIRALSVSATQTVSLSADAYMPRGYLNLSDAEPKPPKVVLLVQVVEPTSGLVQTETRWLACSTTQMVSSSAETAIPCGLEKLLGPEPAEPKVVLLLHEVEAPFGLVQMEIRLLPFSATQRVSVSAEMATPSGRSN